MTDTRIETIGFCDDCGFKEFLFERRDGKKFCNSCKLDNLLSNSGDN